MKKDDKVECHFAKYSGEYNKYVHSSMRQLFQNIGRAINEQLSGVVLDIGNGGVFSYDTNRLEKVIAVDVAYPRKMEDTGNISFLTGDVRDLSFLGEEKFDCVLMQFLLHHVVESNWKQTEESLVKIFQGAYRLLKPGGKIIIIESIVNPWVEIWENLFYSVNAGILNLLDRPMIKFYSIKGLTRLLNKGCFFDVQQQEIPRGKNWIPIAPALFPGNVKVPPFLFPTRFLRILATKPQ
jgi:SAM-dependent methyltransferase